MRGMGKDDGRIMDWVGEEGVKGILARAEMAEGEKGEPLTSEEMGVVLQAAWEVAMEGQKVA